jgi:predicted metal-dependent hydrolase
LPIIKQRPYLTRHSLQTLQQLELLINEQRLAEVLLKRYPHIHDIRTDNALYMYTQSLKGTFMSKAQPLNRVAYDSKIKVIRHALGQHFYISRVQGNKLKTVNEI